jgi:hypothetical protein
MKNSKTSATHTTHSLNEPVTLEGRLAGEQRDHSLDVGWHAAVPEATKKRRRGSYQLV